MRSALGWMLAAAFAVVIAAPSRGEACGNAVIATDKMVAAVKDAEQTLNDGDAAEARNRIEALIGDKDFGDDTPIARGLTNRVRRIRALAVVRLDPDGHAGEYRKALLALAVSELRWLLRDTPDDAAKLSDLGEALAKTSPADAKKLLEDLARRDVVATPYAYAALARLRGAAGDAAGRDAALAKCRPMAKVPGICVL